MSATKTVNKSTAKVGDTLTYTITATNAVSSTVNLRNVVMRDTISEYLSFTHGSVQVDGYTAKCSYDNESRQLIVELGDIAPGQAKTVTFTAVINSAAYGKSFTNTAVLSADNDGDKTATDGGVTVDNGTAEGSVGAKTVSSSTAKVGDTLTYTITLRNASTATAVWANVKVSDVIPEYLSFVSGSVEEDGRTSANASYNSAIKTLTLFADSIAPGETRTFTFKVTVQDGAQGKYIVNTAVVFSDDREDIHLPDTGVQIDAGSTAPYGDGAGNPLYVWRPDDNITLNQICLLGYRMMTDYYRSSLGNGTITVPDGITTSREVQYFISHGVISAAEYSVGTDATQSQIYRILNFAIGAGLASNSGTEMSRASVASLICDLTGRDKGPNTNGLPVAYFSDKGSYKGLIDEVSNSHDYTINSSGKETWISILSD